MQENQDRHFKKVDDAVGSGNDREAGRTTGSHVGTSSPTKRYIGSRAVRTRYDNLSDMGLWRWLRNPEIGFPQPIRIGKLRLWDEKELDAFDASKRAEVSQ